MKRRVMITYTTDQAMDQCPHCGCDYSPEKLILRNVKCGLCGEEFRITIVPVDEMEE